MTKAAPDHLACLYRAPPRLPRQAAAGAAALRALSGTLATAFTDALGTRVAVDCVRVERRVDQQGDARDKPDETLTGTVAVQDTALSFALPADAAGPLAAAVFGAPIEGDLQTRVARSVLEAVTKAAGTALPLPTTTNGRGSMLVAHYAVRWPAAPDKADLAFTLAFDTPAGDRLLDSAAGKAIGVRVRGVLSDTTMPLAALRDLVPGGHLTLRGSSVDRIGLTLAGASAPFAVGEMGRVSGQRSVKITSTTPPSSQP